MGVYGKVRTDLDLHKWSNLGTVVGGGGGGGGAGGTTFENINIVLTRTPTPTDADANDCVKTYALQGHSPGELTNGTN